VSARLLEGNGAALLRERALASDMQAALERAYRLDRVADVGDFVADAGEGERETVLLREADGVLELSVQLPTLGDPAGLDGVCQIIEGVSHFVYLVERARSQRTTTQLELEVQAEVDKWLLLAASTRSFDEGASAQLRESLFEHVRFAQDATSELGERYRVANDAAHAFVRRLERRYVRGREFAGMRSELRRFFQQGQEEKLRLARAA
jgi:hypothetical protein